MQYDLEKSSLQGMYYNADLNIFLEKKKKKFIFFCSKNQRIGTRIKNC